MEVKVFEGKVGKEHYIKTFIIEHFNVVLPRKNEKIVLDGTVYKVIDIIQDYDLDEYNVFVEEYNYDLGE